MTEARLTAELWVSAYLARLSAEGIFAHIVHLGDAHAGSIAVKLATMDRNATLYTRVYNAEGERVWDILHQGAEYETDQVIAKQLKYDRDLWVIEVEDPKGRHLLDQPGLE
ncbi:DUF1491 family protein [Rhodobacteraceae bacterium NNCM2]|nr:DUF1491 family protein [Coraliihabitans acroporae]